jgi:hypothetical protein
MADQPQPKEEKVPSRIVITFAEPNSVLLDVQYVGATPLQVMAAGWVLMKSAEDAINKMTHEQEQKARMEKIAVPNGYGGMIPK